MAAAATQVRSIAAASSARAGQATTSPGMSRSTATALSLWKWPPKPFWYASPGDPDHHRVAEPALGEERQRRRLAAELILGVVQVGEVLDLRDRHQPGQAGAERQPEDRLLVQQGVEDPGRAEPAGQAAGDAVDAALDPDVLAEDDHPAVGGQDLGQGGVDRLGQGARPVAGRRPAPSAPPVAATRSGRRGASGAITSAAEAEPRGRRPSRAASASTSSRTVVVAVEHVGRRRRRPRPAPAPWPAGSRA